MSKENGRNMTVVLNTHGMVYIRGMNADQGKENFNTKETVNKKISPSQALVTEFKERLLDPVNGELFSQKLNNWLDRSEVKKPDDKMKVITPWLQTVVETSLMSVDQENYENGKESIIDWGEKRNMDSFHSMESNMETKWQIVSLLGARNVNVNPENLDGSELVDGKGLVEFKNALQETGDNLDEVFGGVGDVLYEIGKNVDAVLKTKTARIAVPLITALGIVFSSVSPNPKVEAAPIIDISNNPFLDSGSPYLEYPNDGIPFIESTKAGIQMESIKNDLSNMQTESFKVASKQVESVKSQDTLIMDTVKKLRPPVYLETVYTKQQEALIKNGIFIKEEKAMAEWYLYWMGATNNPIDPEKSGFHEFRFTYKFDETGKKAGVLLGSTGIGDLYFSVPIVDGKFLENPPVVTENDYKIPDEYGPQALSGPIDPVKILPEYKPMLLESQLGWNGYTWTREKDGKVVAVLNLNTIKWDLIDNN